MARVLVADDDPLTLSGIELLLSTSNYKVVATASSGKEVLETVPAARAEVLILDMRMPERSGLDVLRTLRSRGDTRPIVLLTGGIDEHEADEAMRLGVNGLVIKASAPRDLLVCLDTVMNGRRWFDQEVLQRAMEFTQRPAEERGPLDQLSPRERGIAVLVQRGLRNREIADELGLTEGTVKVHLHNIFEKLGLRSRTDLILMGGAGREAN